jgi:hypothetical protein
MRGVAAKLPYLLSFNDGFHEQPWTADCRASSRPQRWHFGQGEARLRRGRCRKVEGITWECTPAGKVLEVAGIWCTTYGGDGNRRVWWLQSPAARVVRASIDWRGR